MGEREGLGDTLQPTTVHSLVPQVTCLTNVCIHSPHPNVGKRSSILLALWSQGSPHCPCLRTGAMSVVLLLGPHVRPGGSWRWAPGYLSQQEGDHIR